MMLILVNISGLVAIFAASRSVRRIHSWPDTKKMITIFNGGSFFILHVLIR